MADSGEVGPHLLASTGEVAGRLHLRAGDADGAERAGEEAAHEQLGVLAVALDPVGGRPRRLGGGDDVDVDARLAADAVERIAGRSRLVAGVHRLRQRPQPGDDFLAAGTEAGAAKLSALPLDRGCVGRAGVDVQTHPCQGCGHGRTLLPLHGVSRSQSPARQTPDL